MYKLKTVKQIKIVILFCVFVLSVVSIFTMLSSNAQAQSGFLRCYNRKLEHPDVDCSLCDNLTTGQLQTNKACKSYDAANCTCPKQATTNCDSSDRKTIEDKATGCSESGYFWNDNTCECLGLDGTSPIASFSLGSGSKSLADNFFFKVNWDGNPDNIPEMIRFALIVVFTIIAVAALFLGIYGIYLYTNAGENDDQIKTANKVFKNALIGIGIAVLGVVLVQGVAFIFGVDPDELFTFTF